MCVQLTLACAVLTVVYIRSDTRHNMVELNEEPRQRPKSHVRSEINPRVILNGLFCLLYLSISHLLIFDMRIVAKIVYLHLT